MKHKPFRKPCRSSFAGNLKSDSARKRIVIPEALKAASHPVRASILKSLKEGPASTFELEETTGRSRYDLYHHLSVLEQAGLVEHRFRDGKTKEFLASRQAKPEAAVYQFDRDDLAGNPKALKTILAAVERLEGVPGPALEDIAEVQIVFSLKSGATLEANADGGAYPPS